MPRLCVLFKVISSIESEVKYTVCAWNGSRWSYCWVGVDVWVQVYELGVQSDEISFPYGYGLTRIQSKSEVIFGHTDHHGRAGQPKGFFNNTF